MPKAAGTREPAGIPAVARICKPLCRLYSNPSCNVHNLFILSCFVLCRQKKIGLHAGRAACCKLACSASVPGMWL